jgi:hypothetical protein
MHKDCNKLELQVQDLQHKISKLNKDSSEALKQVSPVVMAPCFARCVTVDFAG